MNFFYEIFPVFLFFMAFKFYDIYVATVVGIVTCFIQVIASRLWQGKWDNKQLLTLVIFVFFGSMTLYFHDPIFVKWKPTIVFWIFGLIILLSQFVTNRPVIRRLMENALQEKAMIPDAVWRNLNLLWAFFFLTLGSINLYVAYAFSNDAWVNFKFYGVTGALFLISIVQALYLMRYLSSGDKEKKDAS